MVELFTKIVNGFKRLTISGWPTKSGKNINFGINLEKSGSFYIPGFCFIVVKISRKLEESRVMFVVF